MSRLDWLFISRFRVLTIWYSCAECLFSFRILLRYWYLHYIIVFVLMHLKVKNIFNFVSLLNEIWRNKFELLILFLRLFDCLHELIVWWIGVIKWSKNKINISFSDYAEDGQCHILKYSSIYNMKNKIILISVDGCELKCL